MPGEVTGVDDGLYNPPWSGRRAQRALATVKARGRAEGAPCVVCHQPIDYSLEHPDPESCSVQHLRSQRDFPQLRWLESNWAPAHLVCNQSAGASTPTGLGVLSEDW